MDHNAEILEFLQGVRDQLLGPAAAPELTAAATALNGAPAVPLPTVAAFWHALGFPADPADRAVTAADLQAIDQLRELVTEGLVDEQLALSMTRAVARTADRLSVWQTQLVAESLAPGDDAPDSHVDLDSAREVALRLAQAADRMEPLLTYAWRRHLFGAVTRMVSDADPTDAGAGPRRVVGFADLVNFTSVVRRASERELAVMVQRFERLASDIVTAHGGRVIKTVGDEVLFVSRDPLAGTAIALDLVDTMGEEEMLPAVRVGLAYGPVLSRIGDVFGTTVNRASRLTAVAGSGRVLADEQLSARLAELSGFSLRIQRRRHLRGIGAVTPREVTRSDGERRALTALPHTMTP